ncbi:MAG: electron transfer flavoprotein subunit alpha/FixB family protein [Oscillospiraceae bacterium]|nr:electron transfer flavoprotein subunit alpha/FixB family protein [Oscillospiraceae bacterium]
MKSDYQGIWVFAEQENGKLHPTVLELLAKSKELQKHNGEKITAVLLGADVSALADTLFSYGADAVLLCENEALRSYSARPYQKALTQLSEKYRPSIILYGATPLGRDLAPRVMVSLDTGLTADAIDLGFDEDGVFYQTTPGYGGKILAHIVILERRPQMATVHAQICSPIEPIADASGELIVEKLNIEPDGDYEVLETRSAEKSGESLAEAKVVVAGGRGVKTEEDLAMLRELADLLGGQLASSRPLVDNGMLPHDRQIGQSGATVSPDLMLNIAISGSVQYQLGMQKAKCIVAINQSEDAPIYDIAHIGAVTDYKKLVPALIAKIKARKQ